MSSSHIDDWLGGLGLAHIVPRLRGCGVTTPQRLARLEPFDLESFVGIESESDRRKLIFLIERVRTILEDDEKHETSSGMTTTPNTPQQKQHNRPLKRMNEEIIPNNGRSAGGSSDEEELSQLRRRQSVAHTRSSTTQNIRNPSPKRTNLTPSPYQSPRPMGTAVASSSPVTQTTSSSSILRQSVSNRRGMTPPPQSSISSSRIGMSQQPSQRGTPSVSPIPSVPTNPTIESSTSSTRSSSSRPPSRSQASHPTTTQTKTPTNNPIPNGTTIPTSSVVSNSGLKRQSVSISSSSASKSTSSNTGSGAKDVRNNVFSSRSNPALAAAAAAAAATPDVDDDESYFSDLRPLDDMPIRVVVRKRPLMRSEVNMTDILEVRSTLAPGGSGGGIVNGSGAGLVLVHEPKVRVDLTKVVDTVSFYFDDAFSECESNEQIYSRTVRPLVSFVLEGGKATVFAYGQTGSGKTFSMMGANPSAPASVRVNAGLYVLAARDLFDMVDHMKESENQIRLRVYVSCFEIYGGKLFDLLNGRSAVRCLEDAKQQVQLPGLTEHPVQSVDEFLDLMALAHGQRSTGSTAANQESSRSHQILQIILREIPPTSTNATPSKRGIASRSAIPSRKPGPTERVVERKLSFIDLAGSERGSDTSHASKQTRLEGAEINTSLLALKEVIRSLEKKHGHTPFRGSKLTQVLKDSFVGERTRTCMLACVSPSQANCEHTLNTLRYADRVKEHQGRATHSVGTSNPPVAPVAGGVVNTGVPLPPPPLNVTSPTPTRSISAGVRRTPVSNDPNTPNLPPRHSSVSGNSTKNNTPVSRRNIGIQPPIQSSSRPSESADVGPSSSKNRSNSDKNHVESDSEPDFEEVDRDSLGSRISASSRGQQSGMDSWNAYDDLTSAVMAYEAARDSNEIDSTPLGVAVALHGDLYLHAAAGMGAEEEDDESGVAIVESPRPRPSVRRSSEANVPNHIEKLSSEELLAEQERLADKEFAAAEELLSLEEERYAAEQEFLRLSLNAGAKKSAPHSGGDIDGREEDDDIDEEAAETIRRTLGLISAHKYSITEMVEVMKQEMEIVQEMEVLENRDSTEYIRHLERILAAKTETLHTLSLELNEFEAFRRITADH